ncbi:MAG: hypothetical protein PHR16_11605 [Methylovulum sp.]|nr:hypothetical protein [Methylovulum sp.]
MKQKLLNKIHISASIVFLSSLFIQANAATPQSELPSVADPALIVSGPVAPEDNSSLPPARTVIFSPAKSGKVFRRPMPVPKINKLAVSTTINPFFAPQLPQYPALSLSMPEPIKNFEGINNIQGYYPPDTNGDVGKTRYIQMVNSMMAIYKKNGAKLYGPFLPSSLWPNTSPCGQEDDGDPVVLFDQLNKRWLVSQFSLPSFPKPPYYECIAVSKTEKPTNNPGDWWVYTFQVPNNKMNDYPKLAVWPNAYFMSANQFVDGNAWGGAGAYAFQRAKMLKGLPAQMVYYDVGAKDLNYGNMLPSDLDGLTPPPKGAANYFVEVDDASWIGSADALRVWKFKVNWRNPAKSTFGLDGQPNSVVNTAPFDLLPCFSGLCIPQPETTRQLDSLGDRLMFRLAYRNFGDHESLTVNHTVLAPNSTDRAGIRWYELRNPGTTPTIFQQGTYAPDDDASRWMGSMAMDKQGNVALGYSVSSATVFPGIRYAGRLVTDPLGELSQSENVIIAGSGSQTGKEGRWGDYSNMTVDPMDDCTFWYTQEYIQTTGARTWQTRIASFKFPECI